MQVRAHQVEGLELLLTLLSVALALRAPRISLPSFHRLMRLLRRLAKRPLASGVIVAALPLVLRAALLPWIPVPQPQIQEEFSYLLGADTFAHGRLANPAHPMALFFDNIQLIQRPHYASARLPGQAAFIALGEALFHLPWMGIYLSVGLMCAAFYWMLRAWTPPAWALLAALLFAIRFGVFTYWMNSYWGGSIVALGGALVLGALPRMLRGKFSLKEPSARSRPIGRALASETAFATGTALVCRPRRAALTNAFLYAIGCCLLASNRPYEGLFFVAPTAVVLAIAWWRAPAGGSRRFTPAFAIVVCVLGAYLGWFAYYNYSTTGNALQTAYNLWRQQQSIIPAFWWQPLPRRLPVYYSRQTFEFNAVWEIGIYHRLHHSLYAGVSAMASRLMLFLQLFVRPLFFLPFLVGAARVDSWARSWAVARGRSSDLAGDVGGDVGEDAAGAASVASSAGKAGNPRLALLLDALWILLGLAAFFVGNALALTAVFLVWGLTRILPLRSRATASGRAEWGRAIPIVILLAGALCAVLTNFSMPTYYAHFTAPMVVLVAAGLVSLASWRRRQGVGQAMVLNLALSCCLMFLLSASLAILHIHVFHESPFNWSSYENRLQDRAMAERFLEKQPGEQLAIVRYAPQHDVLKDWVWNLADIDAQKVVWARELKPEWTAQLVRYYAGRRIWLVEPDAGRILPYPVKSLPPPSKPLPALTYK